MLVGMDGKIVSSGGKEEVSKPKIMWSDKGQTSGMGITLDALVRVAVFPLQPVSRVRGGQPGLGRPGSLDGFEELSLKLSPYAKLTLPELTSKVNLQQELGDSGVSGSYFGVFQAPVICTHWEGVRPIRRSGGHEIPEPRME